MQETSRTIHTPDGEAGVHTARPDGDGPFPVVLFFHHGPGFDEGSKEAVRMIAEQGYYVAALDRYWREQPWMQFNMAKAMAEGPRSDEMRRLFSVLRGTTDEMVESDVTALLGDLENDPAARKDRMGTIGYCIGGRSVLRTMENHPDQVVAGVALHPSFCTTEDPDSPHRAVPSFSGHLYVGFGSEDTNQSPEANKPLIEAVEGLGERGTVEIHQGADHGFSVPKSRAYHEAAATRSYEMAFDLFGRTLL
jgi:carboxymethylenebutenolidase